jgi:hypothetical protein
MITQMNVTSLLQHFSIQVKSLKPNTCPPHHTWMDVQLQRRSKGQGFQMHESSSRLTQDVEEPWSIDSL